MVHIRYICHQQWLSLQDHTHPSDPQHQPYIHKLSSISPPSLHSVRLKRALFHRPRFGALAWDMIHLTAISMTTETMEAPCVHDPLRERPPWQMVNRLLTLLRLITLLFATTS